MCRDWVFFAINANWRLRGFGTVDAFDVQQARWQGSSSLVAVAKKNCRRCSRKLEIRIFKFWIKKRTSKNPATKLSQRWKSCAWPSYERAAVSDSISTSSTAQRDYTQALVNKAQALINFDIAQAQLVHDSGLISVDALTSNRLLSKASAK